MIDFLMNQTVVTWLSLIGSIALVLPAVKRFIDPRSAVLRDIEIYNGWKDNGSDEYIALLHRDIERGLKDSFRTKFWTPWLSFCLAWSGVLILIGVLTLISVALSGDFSVSMDQSGSEDVTPGNLMEIAPGVEGAIFMIVLGTIWAIYYLRARKRRIDELKEGAVEYIEWWKKMRVSSFTGRQNSGATSQSSPSNSTQNVQSYTVPSWSNWR